MTSRLAQSGIRVSASALALIAAIPAVHAQAVTLDSTNSPVKIDGGAVSSVTVASGANAVIIPDGQQWAIPAGDVAMYYDAQVMSSAPASSPFGGSVQGATINTPAGSTLTFIGQQTLGWSPWVAMDSMINASGDVVFEGGTDNLVGANSFLGNVTLKTGAQLYNGEPWGGPAKLTFGANSNVSLESGAYWFINQGTNTATIGGALSAADSTAKIDLTSGTLVVNGKNTAASPFLGTLNITPGANFTVGDAAHAGAIFGDPGHTDGSTLALSITRSSTDAASTLSGYGTIYATVNNTSGIVQPGGTAGTLGTLTVSSYTQGATGILKVEVSPTGASQLKVLGKATLGGTMNITVDSGTYGNNVFTVLSAGSISGSFSSITTSGNVSGAIVGLQSNSSGISLITESTDTTQIVAHLPAANRDHIKLFTSKLYDQIAADPATYGGKAAGGKGVTAWLSPLGQTSSVHNGASGYNAGSVGVIGGLDLALPHDGHIGVSAAWSGGAVDARNVTARAHVTTFDIGAYAGFALQNARVDAVAFYNSYDATSYRTLGSYGTIAGKPHGTAYGASVQLSRALFGNHVIPYLRGTYAYNQQNGISESATDPLALKYGAINLNTFVADVGLRIRPAHDAADAAIRPELNVALEHDFSNPGEHVIGQVANVTGSQFAWDWAGNAQTAAVGSLSLAARVKGGMELFGQVDGRFTSHQSAGAVAVGARYRF